MAHYSTWIRNLRTYSRAPISGDDVDNELNGESDRSVVILLSSSVEDTLQVGVQEKLIKMSPDSEIYKTLFLGDGLLATFSSKIKFAYALGLIDLETRKLLDVLRELRNACAHSRRPITFDIPEVQTALDALCAPYKDILPHSRRISASPSRFRFVTISVILSHIILGTDKPKTEKDIMYLFAGLPQPSPDK